MMLKEKFLENGWRYKNEFVVYDKYLEMNKLNINYTKNDYYCTVVINPNGMALRFRYKNYYQKQVIQKEQVTMYQLIITQTLVAYLNNRTDMR